MTPVSIRVHNGDTTTTTTTEGTGTMKLSKGKPCGVQEHETGWGYQCTVVGAHDQHLAHGSDEKLIHAWPVEDPGLVTIPREWKAIEPATTTLGKPVTDFQVKIWYASGSSEVVSHVDFMDAAGFYSEALDNARVIAAEVHCPDGCLAASFRRELDTAPERG